MGRSYEFGSLEEGLAVTAINRRAEIEFLKLTVVVNAIISVGNGIVAAISKSDGSSSDALNKSIDGLKELLLPHWSEEKNRKAAQVRKIMVEELNRGPLKVKVVGDGKKKKNQRGRRA